MDGEIQTGERIPYEEFPFFLRPPFNGSGLDSYIDTILSDVKEDGGRKILYTFFGGEKNYRNTPQAENLKKIFHGFFESFRGLKKELIKNGLGRLALAVEMQAPDSYGFGIIQYQREKGAMGNFTEYRILTDYILNKIVIGTDWLKCPKI